MKTITIAATLAALYFLSFAAWSNGQCAMPDLQQAASMETALSNWKAFYASFSRFKYCDNGGDISEGYSESVVRLLADLLFLELSLILCFNSKAASGAAAPSCPQ